MTTARQIDNAAAEAAHAALLGALAAKALQPRAAFDPDYGSFTAHPLDPRTEVDDDALTADDAQQQAEDDVTTTTEPLADWLAKKCDCDQGREPIDTTRFEDVDLIDCDRVPVLLACILAGDFAQMKAASCRLRTLYLKAERKVVAERAAELLSAAS